MTGPQQEESVMAAMRHLAGKGELEPTVDRLASVSGTAQTHEDAKDAIERLVFAGKLKVFRPISGDTSLRVKLAK